MEALLGIDIGTSSVKSMLMDVEGRMLGFAQLDYETHIPSPFYAEQDPEEWWHLTCKTTAAALQQANLGAERIIGIGLSGQMHGLVALDENGEVIRPSIIWCDQRTVGEKLELEKVFTPKELGELIQNPVATGFQLLSLMWMKNHEPELYRRIRSVILPKDYVRYRLTGAIGVETTDASSTSAYNVADRCWSEELFAKVGIDQALFPTAGEPWQISGSVTRQAAAEGPFAVGTPVVYGGADQPMQAIGNGIVSPGTVSCTIGTGGQLFAPIVRPVYDELLRTHTYVHAVPDRWYLLGASMSAGLSLRWLAGQILHDTDYPRLDERAEAIPAGSEGVIFLPYLAGDRTPHMDPHAKGMFFGLTLKHTDAHLVRSVLEGVGYSMRDSLEIFKSLGVGMDKLIVSGGGAKSDLWKQILADILGVDVYVSTMREQACFGAAMIAGVGVQVYSSVESACAAIVSIHEQPVVPIQANAAKYERGYRTYKQLYERNRDLFLPTSETE
ncbi:xylulokinase [Paenibacillus lignilyticus]|uniref:Xylulose kinase n=1 Tax=Paenibacillus lignilyticus TaxID=1172615 RepID=A0ABS5CFE2_9BACL|nr:xylulokinase [Paenibacillus lignilyticus]MBP3964592.1 xylulokinase [Paenibacillus lignilyticus]